MSRDLLHKMDKDRMATTGLLAVVALCGWPLGPLLGGWDSHTGVVLVVIVFAVWAVTERRYVVARRRLVRHMEHRDRMVAMSDRARALRIIDPAWTDDDCGGAA